MTSQLIGNTRSPHRHDRWRPLGLPSAVALIVAGLATLIGSSPVCLANRAPSPGLAQIRVSVTIPASAPARAARLIVWWERDGERPKGEISFALVMRWFSRMRVIPVGPRPGQTRTTMLGDVSLGLIRVYALHHTGSNALATLFGRPSPDWRGESSLLRLRYGHTATTHLTLSAPRRDARRSRTPRERCSGPRYRLLLLDAPTLKGRVGNATRRRLCAFLPRSYATHGQRRYPVVYAFPGFASGDTRYVTGKQHLGLIADRLPREMIIVGVDSRSVSGSSYFRDSPFSGQWARFIRHAVAHVDAQLRTIPKASARAVIGQSTGGFNAVSLGLRFSDLFSLIGASAPDALDMASWLTERRGKRLVVRLPLLNWMRLDDAIGRPRFRQAGQMISYAATWSADSGVLRWPANLSNGEVNPSVLRQWLANSPINLLDRLEIRRAARRRLAGRIWIGVGRHDEFGLFPPAQRFSQRLRALGIAHQFVVRNEGHGNGDLRLRLALRFVNQRIDAPIN